MSLSALNSPPLVAALGAVAYASLPFLENLVAEGSIPWTVLKGANAVSFAVQMLAVSRPGRIDGQQASTQSYNDGKAHGKEIEKLSPGRNGRTLVSPSGWAFAIWGPIFLGEMMFVSNQLFLPESSTLAPLIKKATAPFVIAQLFQTLWTASFRPKYKDNLLYISTAMLSGTAYSLSKVHAAITDVPLAGTYSALQYCIYFLPISLHFGWTTAASLVNLNGSVAMKDSASAKAVAWLGHASVIAASAYGVYITLARSAPMFGGVIAWALFAVSDGMKKRLQQTEKEDNNRVGVYGARTQQLLSKVGAIIVSLVCAAKGIVPFMI